jgi:hypothetical protein
MSPIASALCIAGSLLWRAGDVIDSVARDVERVGELTVQAGHGLYGVAQRVIDLDERRKREVPDATA